MIDYTYTVGIDFDAFRTMQKPEIVHVREVDSSTSIVQRIALFLLLFTVTAALLLFILTSIPYFDIQGVTVNTEDSSLPPSLSLRGMEKKLLHSSLLSLAPERLSRELSSHPLVELAQVKRSGERGVEVTLTLEKPEFLVSQKTSGGTVEFLALAHGSFLSLTEDDYRFLSRNIPAVETDTDLPADQLLLLSDLISGSADIQKLSALRYDTTITLHIPRYHVSIDVKGETSLNRLHTAVQLIRLEAKRSEHEVVVERPFRWYDVSQQSLVEKQHKDRR